MSCSVSVQNNNKKSFRFRFCSVKKQKVPGFRFRSLNRFKALVVCTKCVLNVGGVSCERECGLL